ncbi:hypothetical protein [Williamsia muralis]|uniref:hypothetical protein n=1 Tax=Williamsia marianensis TaxID=85044 RepID=UPI003821B92B
MAPKPIGQTDWFGHAIDEMRSVCASMAPSSAEADAEAIRLIAARIRAASDTYYATLGRLYPEGEFHGESVTGSRHATMDAIRHMDDSASVGMQIADQISAISRILSQTQGSVADLDAQYSGNAASVARQVLQQSELATTMTDIYSNPVIGANGSLPEYTGVPLPQLGADFQPINTHPAGLNGSGSGSGDNSGLLGGVGGANNTAGAAGPAAPGGPTGGQETFRGDPVEDKPLSLGDVGQTEPAHAGGSTPGPLNGAFGSPIAGQANGAGATGAATTSARTRPGTAGAGSGGGAGTAARGGGGLGANGAGGAGGAGAGADPKSLAARPVTPLATATAGGGPMPGSGPTTSTRGGSPMIPPGAAGRGGGRDKEGEHRAPSYLHTRENAEEIIGRLPLVGPPVLGDWARPGETDSDAVSAPGTNPEAGSPNANDPDGPDTPDRT